MHGINEGEVMSRYLYEEFKVDVLFVQDHWLSPDQLHKLCFLSSDYVSFGISAMESAVQSNTLVGRPFGGVATLIKNCQSQHILEHVCAERYNIISIRSYLLVNLYLPSISNNVDTFMVTDLIDEIVAKISSISFTH